MDISKIGFDIYKNTKPVKLMEVLYDEYLTGDHKKRDFRDYTYFHPSDMGVCIRRAFFEKNGFDGNYFTNGRVERTFANGHSTHWRLQEHFGRLGIAYGRWMCENCEEVIGKEEKIGVPKPTTCPFCHSPKMSRPVVDNKGNVIKGPEPMFTYCELPVRDDSLNMRGHVDMVAKLKNYFFVIDFKTASDFSFNKLIESGVPTAAYVFQINIYMYMLGIERGIIFYEDSNSKKIKEFYVQKDQQIIEEVKKRIEIATEAERLGSIPPIPEYLKPSRTQPCSFYCKGFPNYPPCPFLHMCHPEEYAKLKNNGILDTFAKTK